MKQLGRGLQATPAGGWAALALTFAHDHVQLALKQLDLLLVPRNQRRLVHDLVARHADRDALGSAAPQLISCHSNSGAKHKPGLCAGGIRGMCSREVAR